MGKTNNFKNNIKKLNTIFKKYNLIIAAEKLKDKNLIKANPNDDFKLAVELTMEFMDKESKYICNEFLIKKKEVSEIGYSKSAFYRRCSKMCKEFLEYFNYDKI
jgi:hypothetical protein